MEPEGHHKRLTRRFFDRAPSVVAPALLGHAIARRVEQGWVGGKIVETEAYLSHDDPASHSRAGLTRRCRSMFAQAGTLYVYSIHAKYCLNFVTEGQGVGSAVLIRAIEPLWGIESMRRRRGHEDLRKLTRGPAMLCQSLGVTTALDGLDLIESEEMNVIDMPDRLAPAEIGIGARIGIRSGSELPLRFYIRGNPFVSGAAKLRA